MAMWELEALLKQHDNNIKFDHLNNWICCYLHIINICLSHIIASSTCISKQYLEALKSKSDGDLVYSNIKDDNDDNNNDDDNGNGDGNGNGNGNGNSNSNGNDNSNSNGNGNDNDNDNRNVNLNCNSNGNNNENA